MKKREERGRGKEVGWGHMGDGEREEEREEEGEGAARSSFLICLAPGSTWRVESQAVARSVV